MPVQFIFAAGVLGAVPRLFLAPFNFIDCPFYASVRGNKIKLRLSKMNPWAAPFILVAVIVCVWLGSSIASPWLAGIATMNALLCGIGLIRSASQGLRPVAAVFYIFSFAWLGVAPIIQVATGRVAWSDISALSDPLVVGTALGMNLLGSAAFFAGAEYGRARDMKRQSTRVVPLPLGKVRPWALALIALASLMIIPIAVQANGGFAALFTSRRELAGLRASMGTAMADIGGASYALTRILPGALAVSGALITIYAIRANGTSLMRTKIHHLLTLSVALACLILFCNPLANSRFTAAAAFGAVVLAWLLPRSKQWAVLFVVVLLTATLFIYPLANAFRSKNFSVKTGTDAFTSADFDGFQQVINTLSYVDTSGHTWGSHIFSGIGFFVPRSIWEGKAEPASFAIAENAGYLFTNLSLPIHAEFYLEFGWIGVLLGMGGLGFIAGRLDHAWLKEPGTKLAMIAPYAALAMLGVIRGPLGGSVPVWGTVVVILMVSVTSKRPVPL